MKSLTDVYREQRESLAHGNRPTKRVGLTLPEIRDNDNYRPLFLHLITTRGKADLAERLQNDEVIPADFTLLKDFVYDFDHIITNAGKVCAGITKKTVEQYRSSSEFEDLFESVGHAFLIERLHESIYLFAVEDPKSFAELASTMVLLDSYEEQECRRISLRAQKLCKKYGIADDVFAQTLLIDDISRRREYMQTVVIQALSPLSNFFDLIIPFWNGVISRSRAKKLLRVGAELQEAVQEQDDRRKEIGTTLAQITKNRAWLKGVFVPKK